MKTATPQALPAGDNSSAGISVSTAATMKACSVAVSVSSGSSSGVAVGDAGTGEAAGWACVGSDPTVVIAAAVPTAPTAPLRKSRRGIVSSAIRASPLRVPALAPD
jgi:hypothetical protein